MLSVALAPPAFSRTASPSAAPAQARAQEVRVVVAVVPPFVMQQNGDLTGFSIDLWDAIGARLKIKTNYQLVPNAAGVEDAMRSKGADLTVVPVFITSARDEILDFSYPIMDTRPANYGARYRPGDADC